MGVPDPATNGYRPQTWVVVAWYSGAAVTCAARPAPGSFHPQAGGTGSGGRPRTGRRSRGEPRAPERRGGAGRGGGRAGFSRVMVIGLLVLMRHAAGQLGAGRSRTARWRPTRRPGCRSSARSRILEDSAAASVSATARGRSASRVDGDRDVHRDQADPGAGGFLGGGLPGAGLVGAVPGGLIPPGAAPVDLPELGGARPRLPAPGSPPRPGTAGTAGDPLGPGAGGDQAGEHVGGDGLPGRLPPAPGHADPAVMPVAAGFFRSADRARLTPAQRPGRRAGRAAG